MSKLIHRSINEAVQRVGLKEDWERFEHVLDKKSDGGRYVVKGIYREKGYERDGPEAEFAVYDYAANGQGWAMWQANNVPVDSMEHASQLAGKVGQIISNAAREANAFVESNKAT